MAVSEVFFAAAAIKLEAKEINCKKIDSFKSSFKNSIITKATDIDEDNVTSD